ncbi:MAG TPA: hypothetical protein VIK48_03610, partial [Candidatus Manganitrophaceae bacterium]
ALSAEARSLEKVDLSYVFPEPLGPLRWKGVLREGDHYQIYLIHSLSGEAQKWGEVVTQTADPRVEQTRKTPLARRIEWFFKAPVWVVEDPLPNQSTGVGVYDLRFNSIVFHRENPFVFHFTMDQKSDRP